MKPTLVTPEYRNKHIEGTGTPSTVGQLIERLQKVYADLPVYMSSDGFNLMTVTDESLLVGDGYAVIGVHHGAVIGEAA